MFQRLKSYLSTGAIMFFIALCVMSFVQIFVFFELTGLGDYRLHTTIITILLSTLTIYLPYLFIPARWRWTVWIPIVVFTLFMLTNVWYYRTFHSFYSGSVIRAGNIFNSFVIEGTIAAMQWVDILIITPPILLIIVYNRLKNSVLMLSLGRAFRIIMVIIWILSPVVQTAMAFRRHVIYHRVDLASDESPRQMWKVFFGDYILYPERHPVGKPNKVTKMPYDIGVAYSALYSILTSFPRTISLTETQQEKVFQILSSESIDNDVFVSNKHKNLIFIVAESFNSSVLKLPMDYNITPELHRIMNDSSIVALNVISQVGRGSSSDGQFIYNTGLYTLGQEPVVGGYAEANYPALAKALKCGRSFEIISEDANVWNHNITTKSYGYDDLYSGLETKKIGAEDLNVTAENIEIDVDGRIFRWASKILNEQSQPFFAFITSISTHFPYNKLSVTPKLDLKNTPFENVDIRIRNYLEAVHHFDESLGKFICQLEENGILENSVIVIVADHSAIDGYLPGELASPEIPLIIYNAGVKLNYEATIGQVDVFPTVLDVMGVESYVLPQTGKEYRGLGRSVFSDNPPTCAITTEGEIVPECENDGALAERMELSSLMIRSRFFEK